MHDSPSRPRRAAAATLLLAGLVAGPASAVSAAPHASPPAAPADAAPAAPAVVAGAAGSADLSITVRGTTITNPVTSKIATLKVTNHGPATATGIRLRLVGWVDGESTDAGDISWCARPEPPTPPVPPIPPGHRLVPVGGECDLPDLPPGRSLTRDFEYKVFGGGLVGTFGEFTTSVRHAGSDPVPANDSVLSRLVGSGAVAGADLYVSAWDVPADASGQVGAVVPGERGDLRFEIGNQGRTVVSELELTVRLPEHVNFDGDLSGCDFDAGRRVAVCVHRGLSLIPVQDDTDPDDDSYSGLRFQIPVRVAESAPAPAHLPGGEVRVRALADEPTARGALAELPQQASPVRADPAPDRDPSDNTDTFTVFTEVDSGGGGGLPVTGVPVARMAGAGVGVVLLGTALLLLTRRRRQPQQTRPTQQTRS